MKYLLGLLATLLPLAAGAQPVSHATSVDLRAVRTLDGNPIRLAHDPGTGALWYTDFADRLVRLDPPYETSALVVVATREEHGTPKVRGLAMGPDGAIYLVGNEEDEFETRGVVRRGTLTDGVWAWEDVLRAEATATTGGAFDHQFSSITFSPDGAWMYIASGSRTDHGEIQPHGDAYPGLREQPINTKLFRLPADARDVVLPNNDTALHAMGAVYAEGFRNAFDLAWDPDGELFAAENSGDRDDAEELNWVRDGHHYGFPWRMGLHDTPQRFPGYDPDADSLVNPRAYAYRNGYFYDDLTYPAPPDGVTFTDPLVNIGPDADVYRTAEGPIRDASETGATVGSFTPHRSPLGLVFDVNRELPVAYRGDGFVLSYTPSDSHLLEPFGDTSEDLLHLQVSPDRTEMAVTRLASGFDQPIDAVLIGHTLYVMELSSGLWALDFRDATSTEPDAVSGLRLSTAPNPSRGDARVRLALAIPQSVRVSVVDALGREVVVLHEGVLGMGTSVLEVPDLAAGVYRVLVTGEQETASAGLTVAR
ncbi:MAG: PQQ-dependent sugar dehydrogenase [Bacteroidota bacterium]